MKPGGVPGSAPAADARVAFDASAYGAWFDSPLGRRVWVDERRVLSEVLGPIVGGRVLDAGCGDGRLAVELAREADWVVGLDRDRGMMLAARERAGGRPGRMAFVLGDVGELPFRRESFDAVTAVTVLCFAHDPPAVVRELARVVRPAGRVVLGELGRWSLWAAGRRLRALVPGGIWSDARFWTARALRALLERAGLIPERTRGAVFYPRGERAARALGRLEPWLGRRTTLGAAFIAVAGRRPAAAGAR